MNKLNIFMLIISLGLVSVVSAAGIDVDTTMSGKRKNCDMSELEEAVADIEMDYFDDLIMNIKNTNKTEDELRKSISLVSNLDDHDWMGNSPLHHACIQKNILAVKLLIEKGVNVDLKARRSGNTPLHLVARDSADIVSLLLEAGADRNLKNNADILPLSN